MALTALEQQLGYLTPAGLVSLECLWCFFTQVPASCLQRSIDCWAELLS